MDVVPSVAIDIDQRSYAQLYLYECVNFSIYVSKGLQIESWYEHKRYEHKMWTQDMSKVQYTFVKTYAHTTPTIKYKTYIPKPNLKESSLLPLTSTNCTKLQRALFNHNNDVININAVKAKSVVSKLSACLFCCNLCTWWYIEYMFVLLMVVYKRRWKGEYRCDI